MLEKENNQNERKYPREAVVFRRMYVPPTSQNSKPRVEPIHNLSVIRIKQMYILNFCDQLISKLEEYQKRYNNDQLNLWTTSVVAVKAATKDVGRSMPDYFKGDLLDFNNYVEHADYFFYGKNLSCKTDKLKREIETTMKNLYGDELERLDETQYNARYEKVMRMLIDRKTSGLKAIQKIDEILENSFNKLHDLSDKLGKFERAEDIQENKFKFNEKNLFDNFKK